MSLRHRTPLPPSVRHAPGSPVERTRVATVLCSGSAAPWTLTVTTSAALLGTKPHGNTSALIHPFPNPPSSLLNVVEMRQNSWRGCRLETSLWSGAVDHVEPWDQVNICRYVDYLSELLWTVQQPALAASSFFFLRHLKKKNIYIIIIPVPCTSIRLLCCCSICSTCQLYIVPMGVFGTLCAQYLSLLYKWSQDGQETSSRLHYFWPQM